MINTITTNLQRIQLLTKLPQQDFIDNSTGPYYSSIGCHVRHILDIFACLTSGFEARHVDLTQRVRGSHCEINSMLALTYMNDVIEQLEDLQGQELSEPLTLIDDLGEGKVRTPATLGSVLFQAHSHAIHHFAVIGYLLHMRNITLPDTAFGYNPTTPIVAASCLEVFKTAS